MGLRSAGARKLKLMGFPSLPNVVHSKKNQRQQSVLRRSVRLLDYSRIICPRIGVSYPKLPPCIRGHNRRRFEKHISIPVAAQKITSRRARCFLQKKYYTLSVGRNHHLANTDDGFDQEPFLSNLLKEAFRSAKSLLVFLIEQPSQLKYTEWPSFQSTLKTATLTLLLVGMLIIALSSVDSALSYILYLLSRRRA